MVKKTDLKKSDLLKILNSSSSLREKNKAVKLLKKFDPNPKKHLDSSFQPNQATVTKYSSLQSFMCWRCDKIKQTMTKVKWETKEGRNSLFFQYTQDFGLKYICTTCYTNLATYLEVARVRNLNTNFK
ncbi:conserved hypothetical protein [Theileria orientalis strain Shintoku]|uniref:Uncharacterized protein n=1 Tax=Theileria orientalis strain Shintoku TaxID=869250 RepID=J4DNN7_THEOR|nr:conserved hypothetical protein [Theileria orientalis strain Shintoku]BAM39279.1 conserved hypothetical protein [Theileria orientalis strain Shintoku]|eukprot:XP_009689580.1 conserved hypothetical protein [Theileria orientalis strain Shintoku]